MIVEKSQQYSVILQHIVEKFSREYWHSRRSPFHSTVGNKFEIAVFTIRSLRLLWGLFEVSLNSYVSCMFSTWKYCLKNIHGLQTLGYQCNLTSKGMEKVIKVTLFFAVLRSYIGLGNENIATLIEVRFINIRHIFLIITELSQSTYSSHYTCSYLTCTIKGPFFQICFYSDSYILKVPMCLFL